MAASKKPRKKYRPRGVLRDPVGHVITGLRPIGLAVRLGVQIKTHDSLAAIVRGEGTRDHWRAVSDALSVGEIVDSMFYGAGGTELFEQAAASHGAFGQRHLQGRTLLYTGPELQAVNAALALHNEHLETISQADMERAIDEFARRRALIRKTIDKETQRERI